MTEQNNRFVPPNSDQQFDPADVEKNKAMGGLAYILFFLPLVACPDSKYGRFHANQGLLLLITSIAAGIVVSIITGLVAFTFSYLLYSLLAIISTALWLAVAVLGIIGLINGFTGKAKPLPVIGKITIIK